MVFVQFTYDAEPIGEQSNAESTDGVNDVHFKFKRRHDGDLVAVQFTKDGDVMKIETGGITVGSLVAPWEANDVGFEFRFDISGFFVTRVYWTKDGEILGEPKNAPHGANDAHVILYHTGRFTEAWWTNDRKAVDQPNIHVPPDANDVHVVGDPTHFPWKKKG
jgi:hypothetical protein